MQFVKYVLISTMAQAMGRAVNIAIALCVLSTHGATSSTDDFLLAFAVAFFFFGTLASAIADATVPLASHGKADPMHPVWIKAAGLVGVVSAAVAWLSSTQDATTALLTSVGAALMAGSGLLAGLYTAFLHARSRYALAGLLWLVRAVPLVLFVTLPSPSDHIGWLALGLGLSDVVRCMTLRKQAIAAPAGHSAGSTLSTDEGRPMLSYYFPILSASAINGLNPLVDRWIASYAEAGSVTVLDAAERIYGVLGTLSTIGVMSVLLVTMSRLEHKNALQQSWPRILAGVGFWAIFWLMVGVALAYPLPGLLGRYASLAPAQADTVVSTYLYYVYGLPAFIIGLAAVRRLITVGGGSSLMPIAVLSVLTNAIASIALFATIGVPGIALGTTVTYSLVTIAVLLATKVYLKSKGRLRN